MTKRNIAMSYDSPVIRQKVEPKNGCFKKTKNIKFPKNFLPIDTHTYLVSELSTMLWI